MSKAWMVAVLLMDPPAAQVEFQSRTWSTDDSPQLQGPLSAEAIRAGLDGVGAEVKRCYMALHAQYPDMVGALEARFVVSPQGLASEVSTADARFPVGWFQGCLQDAIDGARFAAAPAPTTVSWTLGLDDAAFALSASGGAGAEQATSETGGPAAGSVDTVATLTESPVILGTLDKSLIDAVMKRNMNKVRACYEQGLREDPALAGKITVKFVIAKDGTVSKAETKASTMNNAEVEGCINKAFMKLEFPEPKGGGVVIVSYPFIFAPG